MRYDELFNDIEPFFKQVGNGFMLDRTSYFKRSAIAKDFAEWLKRPEIEQEIGALKNELTKRAEQMGLKPAEYSEDLNNAIAQRAVLMYKSRNVAR